MIIPERILNAIPKEISKIVAPYGVTDGHVNPRPGCKCLKCEILQAAIDGEITEEQADELAVGIDSMEKNISGMANPKQIECLTRYVDFAANHGHPAFAKAINTFKEACILINGFYPLIKQENDKAIKDRIPDETDEEVFNG